VAVAVVALALWRGRFSAALLAAVALYEGMQHIRYKGLFVIAVVVIGATILTEVFTRRDVTSVEPGVGSSRPLPLVPALIALAVCLLTCVRAIDLVSSRAYILTTTPRFFGAGESTWFPERAAEFILREHLPGNVFQTWDLGGFSAWRLAPTYADFIDGRDVSPAVGSEYQDVIGAPPDSPQWEAEFTHRNVNTLLFPLSRIRGLGIPSLPGLCNERLFRPVYMDEVSIVLLRDSPENRPWLNRLQIDCSKQQFSPPANASRAELSAFYANAGCIELTLGRVGEAEQALNRSADLAPEDVLVHLALAHLYESTQRFGDAERQFKTAISLRRDNANIWLQLAEFYVMLRRFADARPLAWEAAQLTEHPARAYADLGKIDLALHKPGRAREDFDRADEAAIEFRGRENQHREFYAYIDAGRAAAYAAAEDWTKAIEYQQEATQRMPENPSQWQSLADYAEAAGQEQLAEQARKQAQALSKH
jgi:tetratricopeptide (TPR) repeat protein